MRTKHNTEITKHDLDKIHTFTGWINSIRDHGGVLFIDLRDSSGIIQLVLNPEILGHNDSLLTKMHELRAEFVIEATGLLRRRGEGLENPNLVTGEFEVLVSDFEILSKAKTLPFDFNDKNVSEDIRLKYRYLDLRNKSLQNNLKARSKVQHIVRNEFEKKDYLDIELPTLIKSSEGGAAEVYATSKLFPGEFYSLPQSPQIYKQLLMVGGIEKYYSFAKCFRAEDSRSDRSIEFTQIDFERAFSNSSEIKKDTTDVIDKVLYKTIPSFHDKIREFKEKLKEWDVPVYFKLENDEELEIPSIQFKDAMELFGSDKPDLRFHCPLISMESVFSKSEFKPFKEAECVKALVAKNSDFPEKLSKRKIKELEKFVISQGAGGLAYFQVKEDGLKGPLTKFLNDELLEEIKETTKAEIGDIIFFGAGERNLVLDYMGKLRLRLRDELSLNEISLAVLWVDNFPLFELTQDGKIKSMHHPFTKPESTTWKKFLNNEIEALEINSCSYDIVINGVEIGGGSERIHDYNQQEKIFEILNLSEEEQKDKFGFFVEALQFGTPPHAGCALGLDRLMMLILETNSIRDTIAFPKNGSARELMSDSPNEVQKQELRTLGFRPLRKDQD